MCVVFLQLGKTRNEFSVTSTSVLQTIENQKPTDRQTDKVKATRILIQGTGERVQEEGGVVCGMWHALYMPGTFYPLLPFGISTGILSD